MEALLAALGVGGLDLFGGILSNSSSAAEASKNRRFARDMYKKRYQLTMQDMAKAGLNPVLAAGGGSVGSVPSPGSGPSMDNALGSAANSAMNAAQSVYNIKKTDADTAHTEASTKSINQDAIAKTIKNNYLRPQEEAMVKDAMARAANNTALATLNEARAVYAKDYAVNERDESWKRQHNMTTRDLANYESINESIDRQRRRMDPATERKLAEELYRANILYKQMAPLWGGVNSAARVMAL